MQTFILMLRYATYGFAGLRYGCTGANGTCASVPNDESCDAAAAAADRWIFLCLRCTTAVELAQLSSSVAGVMTELQLSTGWDETSFSASARWQATATTVNATTWTALLITTIYSSYVSSRWACITLIKEIDHLLSPPAVRLPLLSSFTTTASSLNEDFLNLYHIPHPVLSLACLSRFNIFHFTVCMFFTESFATFLNTWTYCVRKMK